MNRYPIGKKLVFPTTIAWGFGWFNKVYVEQETEANLKWDEVVMGLSFGEGLAGVWGEFGDISAKLWWKKWLFYLIFWEN